MADQTKNSPRISRPLSQVLAFERAPDTVIAYRGECQLNLFDFRLLVFWLVKELNQYPKQRFALCFDDSYFFTAALLATLYSGHIPVIPGHLRPSLLKEQRTEFDGLLTDKSLSLDCVSINLLDLQVEKIEDVIFSEQDITQLCTYPSDAHLVLFTSGSTGKPQAIIKPIALLEAEAELLALQWQQELTGSVIVATVSHQHLYGLTFRILLPLLMGLPFYTEMVEYHEQLQLFASKGMTLIASPAYLKRLDDSLLPLQCRMIVSAGGPLSFDEAQKTLFCLGVLPQEIYGTSETGVVATRSQLKVNQPWFTLDGISLSLDMAGNIQIKSPLFYGSGTGLLNDSIRMIEEAEEVREGKQGFHLLGRKDRVVKIEEKRISLTEVEQRLIALDKVEDAAVIALESNNRIILGAVIVVSADGEKCIEETSKALFFQEIRQSLREWLEPVALPKRWRIVAQIAQNSQSKRSYVELQELFL